MHQNAAATGLVLRSSRWWQGDKNSLVAGPVLLDLPKRAPWD